MPPHPSPSPPLSQRATHRRCARCAGRSAICALLLLALALLPLAAAAAAARTVVYCPQAAPVGLQPALRTDAPSFEASARTIYDRLLDFGPHGTEPQPALATAWQVSADGLAYTVQLRHGVRFQSNFGFAPTRMFDADDVLFTFDRMLDPRHPYHAVSGGTYGYAQSMELPALIRAVRKIDPYTVRFELSQPYAPFPALLAMDFASIASAEYAESLLRAGRAQDFDLQPIGTGPFSLEHQIAGTMLRFGAFRGHWRGAPAYDHLVFAITPDSAVRWARLRRGECDIIGFPNPDDLPAMRADPNVRVLQAPGLNEGYLAFNTEHGALRDARVRRALVLAVNRRVIVDAVFGAEGTVASGALPPAMWSFDPTSALPDHDMAEARRLLAAAGHAGGFDLDLWVATGQGILRDPRRIALMIQSDWAAVGVRARIRSVEWAELLARTARAEHDVALMTWLSDNGDPDNFIATLLRCSAVHTTQNLSEYCSRPLDALFARARSEADPARRAALYAQAQRAFARDVPWLPLVHVHETFVVSKRLRGELLQPLLSPRFERLRVD